MSEPTYRRNPFLRVRLTSPITCDLLLDGTSFELPSPELVGVLASLTGTATLDEFGRRAAEALSVPSDSEAVVQAFADAGLLVPSDQPIPEMDAVRHWIERGWLDALIFHLRARAVRFDDDGHPRPEELHDRLLAPYVPELTASEQHESPTVALPPPRPESDLPPLGEVLYRRRSNRPWTNRGVTLQDLATILEGATRESKRLRDRIGREADERPSTLLNSSFSALDILVLPLRVTELVPAVYRYDVAAHSLVIRRPGLESSDVVAMCAGQDRAGSGAVTFVIVAQWRRYMMRYQHSHAYRVLMINGGELGQKLLLFATALGLSTFLTPAFREPMVDTILALDPIQEAAIEAIGIG